jgi:tetratricopeptide (TPR) repeat protein
LAPPSQAHDALIRIRLSAADTLGRMAKIPRRALLIGASALVVAGIALVQVPSIGSRVGWRYEVWSTYLRNWIDPVGPIPTPVPSTPFPSATPAPPTPTSEVAATVTATEPPLPSQVSLTAPAYERQGINNCGPATMAMALRMYGWEGDQYDVARIIKPIDKDRNVNPEELRYYVLNEAGWLRAEYRVAGDVHLLKRLLAANYPVIVEAATTIDPQDAAGPGDDLWAAHYLLITGYDDATGTVTAHDPLRGPDQQIPYDRLMENWKPFNYLYMVLYFPEDETEVATMLGDNWDEDLNRRSALNRAEQATISNPEDAFAWFNLGSAQVYFERYAEAAQAFDTAFTLGLPQRMTRYQFWPFVAYYNADRIDYLLEITEDTYKVINGQYSEEALLWHGYGLLRKGDIQGASASWNKALSVHPRYCDAERAINEFVAPTHNLTGCSP